MFYSGQRVKFNPTGIYATGINFKLPQGISRTAARGTVWDASGGNIVLKWDSTTDDVTIPAKYLEAISKEEPTPQKRESNLAKDDWVALHPSLHTNKCRFGGSLGQDKSLFRGQILQIDGDFADIAWKKDKNGNRLLATLPLTALVRVLGEE